MALRNIIKIDEEKCNGCGKCVNACAEGAIQLINGKAKLVSEIYCDGLGACIGSCPVDAITIEQRDAQEFDENKTKEYLETLKSKKPAQSSKQDFVCPGMMAKKIETQKPADNSADIPSQLGQWPVQFALVNPQASYFNNADLLIAADCVPFAMADFHSKLLTGKAIVVGCPKLDDIKPYIQKLAEIIKLNNLKSITVVHMQVPCCSGLVYLVQEAIKLSGVNIDYNDITISLDGKILS